MFFVLCDVAALMSTCARCGLHFANVMQMGAHTRQCARQCARTAASINNIRVGETDVGDATSMVMTDPHDPDATSAVIDTPVLSMVITDAHAPDATPAVDTPVSSLQSLARREKKVWGRETSLTFNSRPASSSGTLARDFREVCENIHTHTCAHLQTLMDVIIYSCRVCGKIM